MQRFFVVVGVLTLVGGCSGTSSGNPTTEPGGAGGDSSAQAGAFHAGSPASGGAHLAQAGAGGAGSGGSKPSGGGAASTAGGGGRSAAGGDLGTGGTVECDATVPADQGSGSCHDFTPCGGDAVGKWKVDVCTDPPLTGLRTFCPEASETISITGETDIRADHTMQSALTVTTSTTLPASCVAELGTCGVDSGGVNLLKDCMPAANGACQCDAVQTTEGDELTYETSGPVWTTHGQGCPSYSYYCRQGDELWVRGADPKTGRLTVLHLSKQ